MVKSARALAALSDEDIRAAVFQVLVACRTESIFASTTGEARPMLKSEAADAVDCVVHGGARRVA